MSFLFNQEIQEKDTHMKKKFKRNDGNEEKKEKKKMKTTHVGPTLGVNLKVEV